MRLCLDTSAYSHFKRGQRAIVDLIDAADLVPGDVVLLEAGNIVPADLRLLEAEELQADESALTGESTTVQKSSEVLHGDDLPVGDRTNLAFKGTLVTRGRALGLVVATGMHTELGRIAGLLSAEKGVRTPLQRRLARFGRYLALAVLAICVVVFVSGLLQGQPVMLMALALFTQTSMPPNSATVRATAAITCCSSS